MSRTEKIMLVFLVMAELLVSKLWFVDDARVLTLRTVVADSAWSPAPDLTVVAIRCDRAVTVGRSQRIVFPDGTDALVDEYTADTGPRTPTAHTIVVYLDWRKQPLGASDLSAFRSKLPVTVAWPPVR